MWLLRTNRLGNMILFCNMNWLASVPMLIRCLVIMLIYWLIEWLNGALELIHVSSLSYVGVCVQRTVCISTTWNRQHLSLRSLWWLHSSFHFLIKLLQIPRLESMSYFELWFIAYINKLLSNNPRCKLVLQTWYR